MKKQYADRPCEDCNTMIPGNEMNCPNCKLRNGRISPDSEFPGSYTRWVKR
jgi:Zn finger protein HypA/HybF involved in hydrogenase expression